MINPILLKLAMHNTGELRLQWTTSRREPNTKLIEIFDWKAVPPADPLMRVFVQLDPANSKPIQAADCLTCETYEKNWRLLAGELGCNTDPTEMLKLARQLRLLAKEYREVTAARVLK